MPRFNQNFTSYSGEMENPNFTEASGAMESSDLAKQMMALMQMMEQNRITSEERLTRLIQQQDNVQKYQIIPDFSKSISDFNGETLGKTAMDWLEQLETTAIIHKWPVEFKLETAKIHLVGAAKNWYMSNAREIKDYNDFKSKFEKTFKLRISMTEIWEKMKNRRQHRSESIFLYFHDKISLCKQLNLEFEEMKEQILIGLINRKIIPGLMAVKHKDADELLHDIVNFYKVEDQAQGSRNMRSATNEENLTE